MEKALFFVIVWKSNTDFRSLFACRFGHSSGDCFWIGLCRREHHQSNQKCKRGSHRIFDFRFSICDLVIASTLQFRNASTFRRFQHSCDGRFFHLDLYVVRYFYDHRGFLHVRDKTVNAAVRYYAVTRLYTRNQFLLLLLPFFLRPDHYEIHDDENENERHEEADSAGRTACGSGALCLGQEHVQHSKTWRAHLKRESLRCNRSLSCRANMPVGFGWRYF